MNNKLITFDATQFFGQRDNATEVVNFEICKRQGCAST